MYIVPNTDENRRFENYIASRDLSYPIQTSLVVGGRRVVMRVRIEDENRDGQRLIYMTTREVGAWTENQQDLIVSNTDKNTQMD